MLVQVAVAHVAAAGAAKNNQQLGVAQPLYHLLPAMA
jgi:hypothetical protein